MTSSMMNRNFSELDMVKDVFSSVSKGVYIRQPKDEDDKDYSVMRSFEDGAIQPGVYYYDIEYQFSKPLSLELF